MAGVEIRVRLAKGAFTLDAAIDAPATGLTALFGPSGAGKTTLLRCVAGLEPAARGTVRVGAATWQDDATFVPPHRRPVGLVFQDARLFRHMSVADNLHYGWRRVPPSRRTLAPDDVARLLGLGDLLDRRPAGLSGGEAQRVAIGRALLAGPALLLLDEPLASVDVARKDEILPFLEHLHRSLAIPILLVTHDLDDVARLADTVVAIEGGRVRAQGPRDRVLPALARAGQDAAAVTLAVTVARAPGGAVRVTLADGAAFDLPGARPPEAPSSGLRVAARDVGLTLAPPGPSSALAVLPVTVTAVPDGAGDPVVLALDAGGRTLLARVPRAFVAAHGIGPGTRLHAAIHHAELV